MSTPTWMTDCDNFDGMFSNNNPPTLPAQGTSIWKYIVPARTSSWIDAFTTKADFSFGTYEVKFRIVKGGHVLNIYAPIWTISPNFGASSPYSELDFLECFRGLGPRQVKITSWYPNTSSEADTGEFDTVKSDGTPLEFEDGNWHIARFKWESNGKITMWMDDILQKEFTPPNNRQTQPPVRIGCNITNDGNNAVDFEMDVDYIKYWDVNSTPAPPTPPTPPPVQTLTYPSNAWQRLWYVHSTLVYLGETPNEPNIKFDNNWSSSVIAYSKSDDIEFHSSRTISLPVTGNYTFTIGSDDGSKLWIDDILVIDNWKDQAYATKSATIALTAGNHKFRLDYYEKGGGARVSFTYVEPVTPPTQYYTLTIQSPIGSGTTSPATGPYSYVQGYSVPITMTSASGWTLDHYVLDGVNGTGSTVTLIMNANHTFQAVFVQTVDPCADVKAQLAAAQTQINNLNVQIATLTANNTTLQNTVAALNQKITNAKIALA